MLRAPVNSLWVRPYQPADHAFIAPLSAEAFGRYAHDPIAVVNELLADGSAAFVAVLEGDPVGFAVLRLERRARPYGPYAAPVVAHLDAIAVGARARRCGVGATLLDHVEEVAAREGAMAMFLLTAERNRPARALFEAAGYQCFARMAHAYADDSIGRLMTKPLPELERR